jgi:hypothetical protein
MSETVRRRALVVGVLAAVVSIAGLVTGAEAFFHAYLVGFLFSSGLALGALALVCLQHVASGQWGFVSRRVLEAASRTVYWLPVLFVPLLFGLGTLYPWLGEEAADELVAHKAPYLNLSFFLARSAVYFLVWIGLAHQLSKYSVDQDRGERFWVNRLQATGALGMLLIGLTVTFASIEWVMSLEPQWFSTIYGLVFMVGQVLSGLALVVLVLAALSGREPLASKLAPSHFHDLGNLMLAFVLLWAYMAFSQYLIIWSGNLPEEIPWYLHRSAGGWSLLAIVLVVFHFALPFVLLLARRVKQQAAVLVKVAAGVLIARWLDMVWLVEPSWRESLMLPWLDLATTLALGSLWLVLFARELDKAPLLPLNDPRFAADLGEEALEHG